MDKAFASLKEKIRKYNPDADFALLDKAFERCKSAHGSQTRNSGEPYIMHPIEVAHILADMELDIETIVSGLLHDVIEDTGFGYEEVKSEFGEQVAMLVEGVTKLEKIKYTSKEDQQIENLRKMFFAMAKDVRVILIKLADRLHNMRTLKYMPEPKQREKARETLEVYAPLAHRLGISKIKWELEDLSLRHLDSVAYYDIVEGINSKKKERDAYVEMVRSNLQQKMKELGIKAHIEGRAKHFYSIFRKMYMQNKSIDEIYDLFAVRIIINTVEECYATLGMVHEQYKPIPGRFKDYIAMPKPNLYQSLHTTVIGPEGKPFEIQIRTWDMHRVAEQGVAAHWKYKEGIGKKTEMDEVLAWIRQMLDIQNEVTDSEEFMQTLKIDLFADEVFVFTPKGDVISLPAGATPVDFAFAIHSAVGYRMVGAKANSRIVPLDYVLQNGDILEILTTSAVHGPSLDWLKLVKTSQARNKINAWFKKENREENIVRGKEAIERELKRSGSDAAELFKTDYLNAVLRRYGFKTADDMYSAVGYGGITATKIILRLRDYYAQDHKETELPEIKKPQAKPNKSPNGNIEVEGVDNCLVRLSRCCAPIYGDDIVGFITRGRGVSVHRKDCPNASGDALTPDMKQRMVRCEWISEASDKYRCEIKVEANDRTGLLAELVNVLSENKVPTVAMKAKTTKERLALIHFTLEISNREQLETLVKKMHRIPGILEVKRTTQ